MISTDASSTDAADSSTFKETSIPPAVGAPDAGATRIGWLEGHMPDLVAPLSPGDPETSLTRTRRLRQDGWTPEKKRLFLERFAECGVIVEACEAVGMSGRAAYNLRDRDTLFAAGWEAASVMARPKLADEAWSRAMNGVVERIYKDGMVVAERHRYDNRLTMAVLGRLDARIDRAEEEGAPHLALVGCWEDFLAALAEDRREDGLALLAAPQTEAAAEGEVQPDAGDRELHELHPDIEADPHIIWEDDDGAWWTDYPPPAGFDGDEEGEYGDDDYRRTLSTGERAVIDADLAEQDSELAAEKAEARVRAEAQRAARFGEADPPGDDEDQSACA